jgi:hypothetical protein
LSIERFCQAFLQRRILYPKNRIIRFLGYSD